MFRLFNKNEISIINYNFIYLKYKNILFNKFINYFIKILVLIIISLFINQNIFPENKNNLSDKKNNNFSNNKNESKDENVISKEKENSIENTKKVTKENIKENSIENTKEITKENSIENSIENTKEITKEITNESILENYFNKLQKKIRKIELKNGLKIILLDHGISPTFAAYIKFRAGSVDEQDKSEFGLAHMLEHMLFKGTKEIGTINYAKEEKYLLLINKYALKLDEQRQILEKATKENNIEKINQSKTNINKFNNLIKTLNEGVSQFIISEQYSKIYGENGEHGFNAYTTSDLTNYQINLPNNRMEIWAKLEADRMENAVLREFYTERDVVGEERRMRVDNSPQSLFYEKFIDTIYQNHPYGHPVIGPMESIKNLNREQAYNFYRKYYSPNNTVISIVGKIDLNETENLIKKYFGKLTPKKNDISKTQMPSIPNPLNKHLIIKDGNVPLLFMAWFKPPIPSLEDVTFEVLSSILAGNTDSRLYKKLVTETKLAAHIWIENGGVGDRYTNLFFIKVQPTIGANMNLIQKIILSEIEEIKRNGPTEFEISKVAKRKKLEILKIFENNDSLADVLSHFESITGDYTTLFKFNKQFETLKKETIMKFANIYLNEFQMMSAQLIPK